MLFGSANDCGNGLALARRTQAVPRARARVTHGDRACFIRAGRRGKRLIFPMSDLSTVEGLRLDAAPSEDQALATSHFPVRGRVHTAGKFLRIDDEKFWVKGVTYGTFRGEDEGGGYPAPHVVESDFAAMHAAGINTVRVYTVPPR